MYRAEFGLKSQIQQGGGKVDSTSLHLPLRLALREGHVYCLWPLPRLLLVCTTLVCVLFVATTVLFVAIVLLASAHTCTGFLIVHWVFQYYTQIVSTILGVPPG